MIITTGGNSELLAQKLAKQLKVKYSPLTIGAFPDGELYLKFNTEVKKQTLVIVQSFHPHPDQSLFDIVFAANTAKDLGAKKVILVSPYLGYMRQDKRFNPGECVSSRVMAKLLNHSVDKVITIDPHLHRYKSLKEVFTVPAVRLTADGLLVDYLKKNLRKVVIIGPDWESYQWAEDIAHKIGAEVTVLEKTRYNSRHVTEKMIHPITIKGKDVAIIDDIISTGHTLCEAAKSAKKLGARNVYALGVHGLLVENAFDKLKKAGVKKVITTNCIEHETNRIDVSSILVNELKKEK
ncbi:MAG: ribose-phosphate diphosphokinase [Candidatus Woesearchaeota archaeon]|jgi:ribose-phosphate pyrophosphokinase